MCAGMLTIVCAAMLFESLLVGWRRSSVRKLVLFKGSTRNDLWIFLLTGFGLLWQITHLLMFGLPDYLRQMLQVWVEANRVNIDNPLMAAIIWFVLYDFCLYWLHRWSHTIPALWVLHSFHHSAKEMTILTRFRFHPVEASVYTLLFVISLAWLQVPPSYTAAIMGASILHTCLKHSNLMGTWWVGRHVLASPASHYIHHSSDPRHHGTNYATSFQFWDTLFSSGYLPDQVSVTNLRLGLDDDDGGRSLWVIVPGDYLRFLKSCFGDAWARALKGITFDSR